jgi:hypothetical protein
MRPGSLLGALAAAIVMVSVVHAAPPNWRAIDVMPFDIANVKLGMSYDDAIVAMAKHYELSPSETKKLKAQTAYGYDPVTKSQQPISLAHKKDGASVTVYFATRIPVNASDPVGVSNIYYAIPNTKENAAALKEAALAKYGPPSDSRRIANLAWCAHYNQITDCELLKPQLKLFGGSLTLDDPTMAEAIRQYKYGQLKTKPKL